MALLIISTTNQIQFTKDGKLFIPPWVEQCSLIAVTDREYSAFDVVSRKRFLHKYFASSDPRKQFDYNSPFDVFRVLALFCQHLAHEVLNSNFAPAAVKKAEPFLCFVSNPIFPIVLQQVGLGIEHDVEILGYPYKIIKDGKLLPYGYNLLYDLSDVYKLGSDQTRFLLLNYRTKDVFVPGTEKFFADTVSGQSAIYGKEICCKYEELWVVPRVQYCKWSVLRQHFRFKE